MAFELVKYVVERDNAMKNKLSNFTVKYGDLLSDNGDNTVVLVADGAVSADYLSLEGTRPNTLNGVSDVFLPGDSATGTTVLVHKIRVGDQFVAPTLANSNALHNGQHMILDVTAGVITLDNTGTDAPTGKFKQVGVIGVASDKKVLVEVVA